MKTLGGGLDLTISWHVQVADLQPFYGTTLDYLMSRPVP